MKKLILALLLSASALHAESLLYSVRLASGKPAERIVTIVPGTYLVFDGSGNIATKSGLAISDITSLQTSLDGKTTAMPVGNANFVAEGDSRTADAVSWFTVLEDQPAFSGKGDFTNHAFPGESLSVITSQFTGQIYPHRPAATGKPLYIFVFIGTNDISLWGEDYVDDLKAYWALCKGLGATLIVATIPQRGDNLSKETERILVNRRIREASGAWDFLVDVDAMFPNAFDETFFKVDRIHATDFANEKIAACVNMIFASGGNYNGQQSLGDRPAGFSEVVRNFGNQLISGFKTFADQVFINTAIQVGTGGQTFVAYASGALQRVFISNNGTTWIIDHSGSTDDNALNFVGKDAVNGVRIDWNNGNVRSTGTLAGTGVVGTSTNDNALAGCAGEYVPSSIASGAALALTTNTGRNVTSISLTAGDWDVEGNVNYAFTGVTNTETVAAINTTSTTVPVDGTQVYSGVQGSALTLTDSVTLPRKRISVSSTTTVYLIGRCTFSAGAASVYGSITARRAR